MMFDNVQSRNEKVSGNILTGVKNVSEHVFIVV